MRVLFNTYPVAFDCPGGGEIQILKTKKFLEQLGIDVEQFNLWQPQLDSVDIVHYFSVQGGSINFCSHVKRLGLPLIISPILWLGRDKDSYPLGEIRELLHLSDLVLPNSNAEADLLADFFDLPKKKFFVTRNAVDESFFSTVSGEIFRSQFKQNKPFILNVANIEKRKNQLNLIKALIGTGLELVILGNIRDNEYFQECMKAGEGFVKYLGHVRHESELLRSAYRSCELFALPSTLETPGLSALEAAATGAKLVVTSIGCTEEYFEDKAAFVDPYNVKSIREGIQKALSKKKDNLLRAHVQERFTWDQTAIQVRRAYEKVLKTYK